VQTPGHTIGHTSYLISSGDQQLLVLGDVVHNHAIQFQQPQVSVEFDFDEKQAIASRLSAFSQAAKQRYLVAGAHLPFPGLGHIYQVNKQQFEWVPVEYAPLPNPEK
jgi:glyoxylase-like metal-dependent hydrolase (beta-lactamase superfamily II)